MPGLLYIKTFGCQMNEYDSEKMRDVLQSSNGMTLTDDPAAADVLPTNLIIPRHAYLSNFQLIIGTDIK